MCGFSGFINNGVTPSYGFEQVCEAMTDTLSHRGPDDSDIWVDRKNGVALGHRRLAILDLSPLGRQPMASFCDRYVMAYNGEVYNHQEIRQELKKEGVTFKGESDTETMLAAVSVWGLYKAVAHFNGMFAFAIWDKRDRKLSLVRDRIGIKPLYYGMCNGTFMFASELKALRPHPDFNDAINRSALTLFFRHNYIPTPFSIYSDVAKLRPGTILTFDPATGQNEEKQYWDVREQWIRGVETPFSGSEDEALEVLDELLTDSVRKRMLSDVPIGAFLSGGVDSSAVCAAMQAASTRPIKTFCMGFAEKQYDETRYARPVAAYLGTDHIEKTLSTKDLISDIPSFSQYWDEPFSDTGQLTAHSVSKEARRHVTVCLSGDGGDELFLGYSRYFEAEAWRHIKRIPAPIRAAIGRAGKTLSGHVTPSTPGPQRFISRLALLGSRDFSDCYRYQVSHNKYPDTLVLGADEPRTAYFKAPQAISDPRQLMPLWDLESYIHDGILTKVDRASMAEALEIRVPLLDYRMIEFAATIPISMKIGQDGGKHLLRRLLYRHVPRKLVHRPKMGFGVPLCTWLKGDLRAWAEDMLDENLIRRQGFLDPARTRAIWNAFLSGLPGGEYHAWDILMFQSWAQNFSLK